jgi:hypothetical protein
MKPVPSSEPTNIRSHGTKFFCPMDLLPGIYATLVFRDERSGKAIIRGAAVMKI